VLLCEHFTQVDDGAVGCGTCDVCVDPEGVEARLHEAPARAVTREPRAPRTTRAVREPKPRRPRRGGGYGGGSDLARSLEAFRRKKARELKWKAYMVFQGRVITAIDKERPTTREALLRIPGLGPAKVDRFGDEILAVIRSRG
jgi:superfamily II DNA helicase RecQ